MGKTKIWVKITKLLEEFSYFGDKITKDSFVNTYIR